MTMKVLLAGDSTVAACPAGETPMSGWGAHLAAPLNVLVTMQRLAAGLDPVVIDVVNVAKGGANTSSHRGEGLWDALLLAADPGDLVLLQFGHNDQKIPSLAFDRGYARHLRAFVDDAREQELIPVLCTPVMRRHFVDGVLVDTLGEFPSAVRNLAAHLEAPLVDLHAATRALLTQLGDDASRDLFTQFAPDEHPLYRQGIADDTHTNVLGATTIARIVADEIADLVVGLIDE